MVVYENGCAGGGASGVGSDEAVPCGRRVNESSSDGLVEDLIEHLNVIE